MERVVIRVGDYEIPVATSKYLPDGRMYLMSQAQVDELLRLEKVADDMIVATIGLRFEELLKGTGL